MATDKQGKIVINLAGDVMIGRLIDQLLPTSVYNPEEASIIRQFRLSQSSHCPYLQEGRYNYATVWGNTIPLWKTGNLNIINLETSMTTHDKLWPGKVFNYRTHPANIACLTAANIHHVSLANNHTLDFGVKGLEETCESLDRSGAGKTREHALGPVFIDVPITFSPIVEKIQPVLIKPAAPSSSSTSLRIGLLSASDHPSDWSSIPSFHLLACYDLPLLYAQLEPLISNARLNSDFVIFSVHWGPNYQWIPDKKIQELARWMIHQGVDLIHGHSSHHIQGIEIVQRTNGTHGLILYGCGDFLDDYAIDQQYRNDLGALFQLHLSISPLPSQDGKLKSIRLQSLSIFPTRCSNFQVNRLSLQDVDWTWIKEKLAQLSNVDRRIWTLGQNDDIQIDIDT
ncbi:unnamed protein product [Rotaria sp. Silwood2]|nr:unnamed protein product [Rotaria sp. Silwood2]CAF2798572.1 unnamed protein product [Rotaria sp. Silwood2]CAF3223052.1 unnamed protein product [Rotaria sp. Silwood2]CAF3860558.1 unnamed protein product [Rotaria sp. Silwood2]CAF4084138.1 unnamed protein product [Rotaria sp. Silwood2]